MELSVIQLVDLPVELLVMIFKKLNNVQLLYSLMGIKRQLDRILSDSIFTKNLTLFTYVSNSVITPLINTVLDRFCLQILPQIHDQINILNLESSSIERILLAADYPNLYGLGLYNIDEVAAEGVFAKESPLSDVFSRRIQSLVITLTCNKTKIFKEDLATSVFTNVLTMFTSLRYLNCHPFFALDRSRLWFDGKSPKFCSSTLMELHIKVVGIDECLYLLDGRLNQLHTLDVYIDYIDDSPPMINQKKSLSNMKYFLLMCRKETFRYKESIVPLLQRMINLEKLVLSICVHQVPLLDGNCLKKDITNHLLQLNKFIFNIRSLFHIIDQTDPLSNEDIQHTLKDLEENEVISYVDYCLNNRNGQCHFFSYPYKLEYFDDITNQFPDGLFKCVRQITLNDERPFEYEFFIRITQSFPLLENLSLTNRTPQKQKLINSNQHFSILEYPHLTELDFNCAHDDYIEQFLMDTKTSFPDNIQYWGDYDSLKRVTHNFTRKATRDNCAKIHNLHFHGHFQISKRLTKYFPHAKMATPPNFRS